MGSFGSCFVCGKMIRPSFPDDNEIIFCKDCIDEFDKTMEKLIEIDWLKLAYSEKDLIKLAKNMYVVGEAINMEHKVSKGEER